MKEAGKREEGNWAEISKPQFPNPHPTPDLAEMSSQSQGSIFPTVGGTV